VKFVDLVTGIAVRDETDDATGMTQKIVMDWRAAPKGNELKPELILVGEDGEPVRNDAGNPVTYPMSVDAILSVEDGQDIQAGDVVARIPREGAKTKDITGGLPRVAELFEARRPKDHAIIAEIDGHVRFGKDYKNKRRISIEPVDDTLERVEYMVPKGKHIPVVEGDYVQKGDFIMDGNPAPHDILSILGVEALANYMINEVQEVYRLQGVKINDKHIEVIVRQMLQKWEISTAGDTTLLKGEHVDKPSSTRPTKRRLPRAGAKRGRADPAGHHQGVAADAVVHFGRFVSGDHARAHRGIGAGQEGQAGRPEGERDRRASDPGRHRRRHPACPPHRRRSATMSCWRRAAKKPRRPRHLPRQRKTWSARRSSTRS
jgi:DNA-directed RNA polymerase subunit beta'